MIVFNKNKWIRTYLSDLLIDPLAHYKKYKKKPWNISVNDIVDSLRIDEIDMYVMSNEVADNPRTEHAIFAKTSAGEYCSYYFGDRGEGNHYYESLILVRGLHNMCVVCFTFQIDMPCDFCDTLSYFEGI